MRTARQRAAGLVALAAVAAGAMFGVVNPIGVSPAAAAAVNIRLININDFHGRIDNNTVKFAGTVEQVKAAAPTPGNTLFAAAGDLVGASLFASAVQNDDPTIDVLNALELQSSSVGNHEFDKGFNDLTTHIEPRANWTYLCANCYNAGTTTPALPEFQVFTVGGVTVGVIGAVTEETPSLVSPGGIANLSFGDPVAAVNRVAAQLSDGDPANGEAAIIVAEYHEGANSAPSSPATSSPAPPFSGPVTTPTALAAALNEPTFAKIANNTSALVDVIFNGHTHKPYTYDVQVPGAAPGKTRPIVQTGQYGEFVGIVDLVVENTTGTVASYTRALTQRTTAADSTLTAAFPRVAQVKTIVDAAIARANEIGASPVARVTADITTAFSGGTYTAGRYTGGTRDDRARESTLGNLVADSILASLEDPARGGAEIAVTNPGGLRDELLFGNDGGVITFAEANAVVPFANTLNTITLTGAQVKTLLEQQWQRTSGGAVPSRPYLQLGVSKNLTYTFDPTRAEGDRITSINVNGATIDPARNYRVGAFSFLTEGGDNFHVFRSGTNRRDSGLIDRDAFIAYLAANSPLSPDFARRAVQASSTFPLTANPGTRLQFTVSQLDLTSLGSPQNIELDIYVGGVRIAIVPVSGGTAIVDVVVPELPTGARHVSLVARPSGTLVNPRALNPIPPTRLADTRGPGESANAVRTVPVGKIGGDNVLRILAADIEGLIPALGVTGVSLNVAVDAPDGAGFVTVYDCGTRRLVASVNYLRGETVSNQVLAPVSDTGEICIYSLVPTHVVIDVNGWFAEGYNGIEPNRVFDTRAGESPDALRTVPKSQISGDPALEVKVTDLGTNGSLVPGSGVGSVSLNIAVTNAARGGFITVYPCGSRSLVASINFTAGQTVSNSVVVPVSPTGTVCFYSPVPTDLIVDINGWFASSSSIRGVTPTRLFDTRANEPGSPVVDAPKTKVGGANILEVKVTALAGLVPATGVGSVSLNVAVTNPAAAGFVTVYPCGNRPFTANVNYSLGETVSNGVIVPVSANGTICFYSLVPTDLVADINNFFVS